MTVRKGIGGFTVIVLLIGAHISGVWRERAAVSGRISVLQDSTVALVAALAVDDARLVAATEITDSMDSVATVDIAAAEAVPTPSRPLESPRRAENVSCEGNPFCEALGASFTRWIAYADSMDTKLVAEEKARRAAVAAFHTGRVQIEAANRVIRTQAATIINLRSEIDLERRRNQPESLFKRIRNETLVAGAGAVVGVGVTWLLASPPECKCAAPAPVAEFAVRIPVW